MNKGVKKRYIQYDDIVYIYVFIIRLVNDLPIYAKDKELLMIMKDIFYYAAVNNITVEFETKIDAVY